MRTRTLCDGASAFGCDPHLRRNLRPPAVPLVCATTVFQHLVGRRQIDGRGHGSLDGEAASADGYVFIDNNRFRIMGKEPTDAPALPQTNLGVLPTRTIYTFENGGVE
jgi:hypothetical protein